MSTDGGGWTLVFIADTTNFLTPPAAYMPSSPALMTGSTEVLLAYRDSTRSVSASHAAFPMPPAWRVQPPFSSMGTDVMTSVRVDGGPGSNAMLRFGSDSFANSRCDDQWAPSTFSYGRICIVGTSAPFFSGFASSSVDTCSDSGSNYNTAYCTNDVRFSIAVR